MYELIGDSRAAAYLIPLITVGLAGAVGWWIKSLIGPAGSPTNPKELGRKWAGWIVFGACMSMLSQFFGKLDFLSLFKWLAGGGIWVVVAYVLGWGYGKFFKFKSAAQSPTTDASNTSSSSHSPPPKRNTSNQPLQPAHTEVHAEVDENAIYAAIAEELKSGNTDQGLWIRLFAESDGDESKTKVAYIKRRAEILLSELRNSENGRAREAEETRRKLAETTAARTVASPRAAPANEPKTDYPSAMGPLKWMIAILASGFVVVTSYQYFAPTKPLSQFKDCTDCPEMVVLPAGSFEMGSTNGDKGTSLFDGKPVHTVHIAKPFAFGKTEVTQGQWRAVMGHNPSGFAGCGDHCPVENVSWNDAKEFVRKLNAKTGKSYRLPSEAEWEYACRAGGNHSYCGSDNIDGVAWTASNSGGKTHAVAGKQANAWGLYDMSGNVWEWTEDCGNASYNGAPYDGSAWTSGDCGQRTVRSGSWNNAPEASRAAFRVWIGTRGRYNVYGLRLVRMLP